ncbi:hypothetical protein [Kineococcus sp. NPDC059986]|uniref:hypothetical protein n=1 Tax=Kineococcus sp. NPDC059986 TaxID=3155538 RepID=UPI00344CC278
MLDEPGGEAGGCVVVARLGGAAQVAAPVGAVPGQWVYVVAGELGTPLLTPACGEFVMFVGAAADDGGFVEGGATQVVQEQPRLVQRLGPLE